MFSPRDANVIPSLGQRVVVIQSDPVWFWPGRLNELVEFEIALTRVCCNEDVSVVRFIPYAPYLFDPEPDPAYFAEVRNKMEVSSVTSSGFESRRLNGTIEKFEEYGADLDVELVRDTDILFSVEESSILLDRLYVNSTPMNSVGFSRMGSFFFDPYKKVEFDE